MNAVEKEAMLTQLKKKKAASYLGNSRFMLLHELVHVLLVFLHARLQVVLLPLHTAQLFLQLGEKK